MSSDFSEGGIKIWAAIHGTPEQGESLDLSKDNVIFKKTQFDDVFYGSMRSENGAEIVVDVDETAIRFSGKGDWNSVKSFKLSGRAEDLGNRDAILGRSR